MANKFIKDWASEAFGIILLEYHNKNHLSGNELSRDIAVAELMNCIMRSEITEEIRTHAQNVQNWVRAKSEFFPDPKTQCEMIQNELLLIIGLERDMYLLIQEVGVPEDPTTNPS